MKSLTSIHPSNLPVIDPPPTHALIFPHVHLTIHVVSQTLFIYLFICLPHLHPSIHTYCCLLQAQHVETNNIENQFPALKEPTIHQERQGSGHRTIYFLCHMCPEKGHLTQCEEVRNACTVLFELSLKFN